MATTTVPRNRRNRDRLASPVTMAVLYVILTITALASAFPFYYMLVTSTYRTVDILRIPPPIWFGQAWMQNYNQLLSQDGLPYFWTSVINSLSIASLHTVAVLFFCSLAGYGFAKFRFPGRDVLFAFLIATLNDLDILGADIGNAYLNAYMKEKVHMEYFSEFIHEFVRRTAIIVHALYGLNS